MIGRVLTVNELRGSSSDVKHYINADDDNDDSTMRHLELGKRNNAKLVQTNATFMQGRLT